MTIELNLHQHSVDGLEFQRIHFENKAEGGVLAPADIKGVDPSKLEKLTWAKGVVIEGRGPVWLYAYLVHECHPAKWVGTYDPRLGVVVVETHSPEVSVGQMIELAI
jgi:CRISPR-associated protein Csx3